MAGETYRGRLLIGKTYTITSSQPIDVVGLSSSSIEIDGNGTSVIDVVWPVTFSALEGNGANFMMRVVPSGLGGTFEWSQPCCGLTGYGNQFWWAHERCCWCDGCYAQGWYLYEGYALWCEGGRCCCPGDDDDPYEPQEDDGPYAAGASVEFSEPAVIFEDAYTNTPSEVVARRSTQTTLTCIAHGGETGGTATFSVENGTKLVTCSGGSLPVTRFVPPQQKVEFEIVYEGRLPSDGARDIVAKADFTERGTGTRHPTRDDRLTSVKVEITRKDEAPIEACRHRHVFGVQEGADCYHYPSSVNLSLSFNSDDAVVDVGNEWFYCPWKGGEYELSIGTLGVEYISPIRVLEPLVVCRNAEWDRVRGTVGCSGQIRMNLFLYVEPSYVSFDGIFMEEIPDTSTCQHDGYFNDPDVNKTGAMSHSESARAGEWIQVHGDEWAADRAERSTVYPQPWMSGWKEWQIPIGWGDLFHALRGQIHPNPTTQRFTIAPDGAATIRKYNHTIERRINNDVYLDGELQQ